MDEIKAFWNSLPWYMKLFFPLLVFGLLYTRGFQIVTDILEKRARERVDTKEKEILEKLEQIDKETAQAEGRLEQLEHDRDDAVKQAGEADDVDFHNSRGKDE
jgi:F0F1-type ATP synthase membrane subunit b/b'